MSTGETLDSSPTIKEAPQEQAPVNQKSFLQHDSTSDLLKIGKTLGVGGSCKVKVAEDNTGSKYAMKTFTKVKKYKRQIAAEIETLTRIKHPHIVNMIEHGNGLDRHEHPFHYILLELANGGSMFDYAAYSGRFDEVFARHYFLQLMEGLAYLHAAGFAHRDLKPENLLVDDNYNLKITDFGFARSIYNADGPVLLRDQLGTTGYMAPEIHLGKAYTG